MYEPSFPVSRYKPAMPPQDPLLIALEAAAAHRGATAPNPPVGAIGLDSEGRILAVGAHERAGTPHAEVHVLESCRRNGTLHRLHTLVVTLEPCNHVGRTGPCTDAILRAGIRRVFYGCSDPNPQVAGGGAERLREAGLEAHDLEDPRARDLIGPFTRAVTTGLPWVTVKIALDSSGAKDEACRSAEDLRAMIPPSGRKTFTSLDSLRLAHGLRRRSDAILTGSGTVLADDPEFTVRHVPDHIGPPEGKRRWLALLDRRGRVPREWLRKAEERGFRVLTGLELGTVLGTLVQNGVHEVLVEAGPTLTRTLLDSGLWNEEIRIEVQGDGKPDVLKRRLNPRPASAKQHEP